MSVARSSLACAIVVAATIHLGVQVAHRSALATDSTSEEANHLSPDSKLILDDLVEQFINKSNKLLIRANRRTQDDSSSSSSLQSIGDLDSPSEHSESQLTGELPLERLRESPPITPEAKSASSLEPLSIEADKLAAVRVNLNESMVERPADWEAERYIKYAAEPTDGAESPVVKWAQPQARSMQQSDGAGGTHQFVHSRAPYASFSHFQRSELNQDTNSSELNSTATTEMKQLDGSKSEASKNLRDKSLEKLSPADELELNPIPMESMSETTRTNQLPAHYFALNSLEQFIRDQQHAQRQQQFHSVFQSADLLPASNQLPAQQQTQLAEWDQYEEEARRQHQQQTSKSKMQQSVNGGSYAASLVNITAPLNFGPHSATEAMELEMKHQQQQQQQHTRTSTPPSTRLKPMLAAGRDENKTSGSSPSSDFTSSTARPLSQILSSMLTERIRHGDSPLGPKAATQTPMMLVHRSSPHAFQQASGFRSPVAGGSGWQFQSGAGGLPTITSQTLANYMLAPNGSLGQATVAPSSGEQPRQQQQRPPGGSAGAQMQSAMSSTVANLVPTTSLPLPNVPTTTISPPTTITTTNDFITGTVANATALPVGPAALAPSESTLEVPSSSQQQQQQQAAESSSGGGTSVNRRGINLTRVEHISAECSDELIRTVVVFNGTFKGIIYSSGYVRDPNCLYINGTGKTRYEFTIRLNQCGTLGRQEIHPPAGANEIRRRDQVMWNSVSVQYNPLVEQEWDEHYRVSCEYGSDFWKTISFNPFKVETNTGAPIVFTVDPPQCQMEILRGHGMVGPRQETVSGPVTVGDPLTLLIHMRSERAGYDILVKNCVAHNGGQQKMQLIDSNGCVVNERFISPFRGTYDDTDLKHVTLYSYLKAFRFTGSPVLYLECEVHMCQSACPPQMCYWRSLSKRSTDEFELQRPTSGNSTRSARRLPDQLIGSRNTNNENEHESTISDSVSLFQALEVRQERQLTSADQVASSLALNNAPEPDEEDKRDNESAKSSAAARRLCYQRAEVFAFLLSTMSLLVAAVSITIGCCLRVSSLKADERRRRRLSLAAAVAPLAMGIKQQQQQQHLTLLGQSPVSPTSSLSSGCSLASSAAPIAPARQQRARGAAAPLPPPPFKLTNDHFLKGRR